MDGHVPWWGILKILQELLVKCWSLRICEGWSIINDPLQSSLTIMRYFHHHSHCRQCGSYDYDGSLNLLPNDENCCPSLKLFIDQKYSCQPLKPIVKRFSPLLTSGIQPRFNPWVTTMNLDCEPLSTSTRTWSGNFILHHFRLWTAMKRHWPWLTILTAAIISYTPVLPIKNHCKNILPITSHDQPSLTIIVKHN